jgi:NAD(P)-dependent dehydrogenase (short-subunit alcohol dehydrogenase family)
MQPCIPRRYRAAPDRESIMTNAAGDIFGLTGKVALVTGAASGIGEGIAHLLADAGATVVLLDRNGAQAQAAAQAIGRGAIARQLDVADEAAVVTTLADVIAELGAPWLLVNCAGVQDRVYLLEGTGADWDRNYEVNLRGAFFCLREVAKAMIAAGVKGRIVNITSVAASAPIMIGLSAYAASKHGLLGLTRSAAMELMEHGITVNSLQPGGVMTPGSRNAAGPGGSGRAAQVPVMGWPEPREIGGAVLYFASALAGRTTGQTLAVDAGFLIG